MDHEKHEWHEKILSKESCYLNYYSIRGEVFEVYREMGCVFLEPAYQEYRKKAFCRRDMQKLNLMD